MREDHSQCIVNHQFKVNLSMMIGGIIATILVHKIFHHQIDMFLRIRIYFHPYVFTNNHHTIRTLPPRMIGCLHHQFLNQDIFENHILEVPFNIVQHYHLSLQQYLRATQEHPTTPANQNEDPTSRRDTPYSTVKKCTMNARPIENIIAVNMSQHVTPHATVINEKRLKVSSKRIGNEIEYLRIEKGSGENDILRKIILQKHRPIVRDLLNGCTLGNLNVIIGIGMSGTDWSEIVWINGLQDVKNMYINHLYITIICLNDLCPVAILL